jgi:hypothetical protein
MRSVSHCPYSLRFRPCSLVAVLQFPLDPSVGNQPEERGEHVHSRSNPWTNKREWNGGDIKHKREFTLSLPANGPCHKGVATFLGNDSALKNNISNSCHHQDEDDWCYAHGFFQSSTKNCRGEETEGNIDQRTRDSEPEGNAPVGLFFNIGNICLTRHGRRR